METLLWGLVCLFGVAALADKVMTEEAVVAWRARTRELRGRVEQIDVDAATAAANEWFVGLFDAIYDARFWSLRRFVRSALSSLLALAVVTLLLGWEETILRLLAETGREGYLFNLALLAIIAFGSNVLADYFSLQETRWVLGRSRAGSGIVSLFCWIVFDLLATAVVFMVWFMISVFVFLVLISGFGLFEGFREAIRFFFGIPMGVVGIVDRGFGLPFFITTFFTSALWISYVISALGVRALRRNSRVLRAVLGTIAESRAPARATAGFLTGFLALGYGLVAAVAWTVG